MTARSCSARQPEAPHFGHEASAAVEREGFVARRGKPSHAGRRSAWATGTQIGSDPLPYRLDTSSKRPTGG